MINYAAISREAGVSLPTVKAYYQLLEDMFIGFRVTASSGSPRKSLLSTERFYFFDIGVRHAAAELPLETAAVRANPGPVFEQWVGTELWKRLQYLGSGKLHYLRTKAGAEVDFIIARRGQLTPIEVKWTEHSTLAEARHLITFLKEHPQRAPRGYVICRCREALALNERITALPWYCYEAPMIGRTLDHYRIEAKLGEGGMGVVYRARDLALDRPVAIKVPPHDRVADPGRKQRFVQEARAASALTHPNIVTIHDTIRASPGAKAGYRTPAASR
jgi:hypothetical protein